MTDKLKPSDPTNEVKPAPLPEIRKCEICGYPNQQHFIFGSMGGTCAIFVEPLAAPSPETSREPLCPECGRVATEPFDRSRHQPNALICFNVFHAEQAAPPPLPSLTPSRWSLKAAEEIFALFKNASYFSTRNAEHRREMLEGWAQIIDLWHFNSGCSWGSNANPSEGEISHTHKACECRTRAASDPNGDCRRCGKPIFCRPNSPRSS